MASVLIVGATGYIGNKITQELARAGVKTTALIRNPKDTSKPGRAAKISHLESLGVGIVEGDTSNSVDELASILKRVDTVIATVSGDNLVASQLNLLEAAKRAGTIKRFIPSEFGGDYTTAGPEGETFNPALKKYLGAKEEVLTAVMASGIPWTAVINYGFYGYCLPKLGALGPPPVPETASVYNGGNVKGGATAEEDIGKVVARAVNDPRTANKRLVIKGSDFTQNQIIAAWETVSGKTVARQDVSAEDLIQIINGGNEMTARYMGLVKSFWVDGLYERPPQQPCVLAAELYPDIKFKTVEEFLHQFVQLPN